MTKFPNPSISMLTHKTKVENMVNILAKDQHVSIVMMSQAPRNSSERWGHFVAVLQDHMTHTDPKDFSPRTLITIGVAVKDPK